MLLLLLVGIILFDYLFNLIVVLVILLVVGIVIFCGVIFFCWGFFYLVIFCMVDYLVLFMFDDGFEFGKIEYVFDIFKENGI